MSRSPKPSEADPSRIAPLPTLPLFMRLQDRPVLAVGGTEAMLWKLELLVAAGARPTLAATAMTDLVARFAAEHDMPVTDTSDVLCDLQRYALIIVDCTDPAMAQALFEAAVARGIPINQIDRPALCTVQFGTIVNRSPVVVSISTDGAAPVLGQTIRRRIETMLPRGLGAWGEQARQVRWHIAREIPVANMRRAWWARFADVALSGAPAPEASPGASALPNVEACSTSGHVTLVGAGPGDPDLLTIKAMRALQNADVVLFDALVSDEILELARREARRMPVGKRGGRTSCRQEDINRLMIRFARKGQNVVRLKAGDPAIFSRGAEEVSALQAQGISVSIVPGITTASAAAASLGQTLTNRQNGRQLLIVSGHGREGENARIDWRQLAEGGTTLALYMGRMRLPGLARDALGAGVAADLPVAIGTDVSRETETWRHTTLAMMVHDATWTDRDSPCLILIGRAFARADAADAEPTRNQVVA